MVNSPKHKHQSAQVIKQKCRYANDSTHLHTCINFLLETKQHLHICTSAYLHIYATLPSFSFSAFSANCKASIIS